MPVRRAPAVALLGAVSAAVLVAPAAPAAAHGGSAAAFTGRAGDFTVFAYDARKGSSGDVLEYRVILTETEDGTPVNDATVTLEAEGPEEVGPLTAEDVANIYYYELPDPGDDTWKVRARVEGPADGGEGGTVSFTMHGLEEEEPVDALAGGGGAADAESSSGLAAVLGVLAAAGLVGVALGTVRLRRRPTPRAE